MSVLVKMPHIEIEIKGEDSQKVIDLLKSSFSNVKVINEKSVDIDTTDWNRNMEKSWTPAKELRANRNKFQLTQKELGEKIGKGKQYISDLENGRRNINIPVAKLLGEALQKDYHHFL
ncbi:MAG: helix-turn-helix transcriptional regulator [Spirochaetaceae bacterium]|jgi:DNA-binding XRE family transcriptional regulator|nr:helix-turn-helix transcriptional regulator [Spirochaetaceae bacterium]